MSKLTRFFQKVFANAANANELAQYGSFAAGVPAQYSGGTVNPDLVQALANFDRGLFGATIGNGSSLLQDTNAMYYLVTRQIAYVMQQGTAEWDVSTTYFIGSLASSGGIVYRSVADNNVGNAVSDAANWAPMLFAGLVTQNDSAGSFAVVSGQSLFYPNLVVQSGDTISVDSGGSFIGVDVVTVNGTLVINGTAKVL